MPNTWYILQGNVHTSDFAHFVYVGSFLITPPGTIHKWDSLYLLSIRYRYKFASYSPEREGLWSEPHRLAGNQNREQPSAQLVLPIPSPLLPFWIFVNDCSFILFNLVQIQFVTFGRLASFSYLSAGHGGLMKDTLQGFTNRTPSLWATASFSNVSFWSN